MWLQCNGVVYNLDLVEKLTVCEESLNLWYPLPKPKVSIISFEGFSPREPYRAMSYILKQLSFNNSKLIDLNSYEYIWYNEKASDNAELQTIIDRQ